MRTLLTPRMLGAHLLALVAMGAAVALGLWQYDAWQQRRSAEAVDLTQEAPVPLTDVIGPSDGFPGDRVGQPVTLAGTWVPDATVLVSGRLRDGVDGFWVVTPVEVADAAVPVVRGWVASVDDAPAPPTGGADLVGWLQPPEGSGAVDQDPTDDVFPQLRVADLVQRLDGDVYSAYAVAQDGVGGLPAADRSWTRAPACTQGSSTHAFARGPMREVDKRVRQAAIRRQAGRITDALAWAQQRPEDERHGCLDT